MDDKEPRSGDSDRWTYLLAAVAALAIGGYFLHGHRQAGPGAVEDPRAQVESRAQARMAGVRCIGGKASSQDKQDIARLLAIDILAPHGGLPAWLPAGYAGPGGDAWRALARDCPDAPAFGTPFGFPSADIERELRHDPEFAALSDARWADIRRHEAASKPAVSR